MHGTVILAGGRSRRFGGGDKAVADLAGEPMVRRVADRVSRVTDELVVNCRDEQVDPIREALAGVEPAPTFATDPEPDLGPVAGIATGLDAVGTEYALVVACDMPFVDPALVEHLFERAAGHDAAVPRPDEWFQTTQAVYRAAAMADACRRALERDERRVVEALFELDYVVVEREEVERHASPETFENVNTREELEAAARRLE